VPLQRRAQSDFEAAGTLGTVPTGNAHSVGDDD
jgi:hypothetical protein